MIEIELTSIYNDLKFTININNIISYCTASSGKETWTQIDMLSAGVYRALNSYEEVKQLIRKAKEDDRYAHTLFLQSISNLSNPVRIGLTDDKINYEVKL